MYKITINERAKHFKTFKQALAVADEIFNKTGVIVGIEKSKNTEGNQND